MTEERGKLLARIKEREAAKKAAKGNDVRAFLENARGIVADISAISRLPTDNQIDDRLVNSYCWALYAIASKTSNRQEARDSIVLLVAAFRRKIDSNQFWGAGNGREFGKTLFSMIVVSLYNAVKSCADGTELTFLRRAGKNFLEMLDLRAEAFLDEEAFRKAPVTDEQRAAMERKAGKRIRLRFWPSLAEKAFGVMNRCLKADAGLVPSRSLVDFLARNKNRGDWLGFYCANAMIRLRDWAGARGLLAELVRSKPNEAWAWSIFAEACGDKPEDAVSCHCKALTCPPRDREIALGMAVKTRRTLGRILLTLGRNQEAEREISLADAKAMPDGRDSFYRSEAKKAEKLVLGDVPANGGGVAVRKRFSGTMRKKAGVAFGFVGDHALGSVFVPPRFAEAFADGQNVRGVAAMKEDKKKKRMGWCMVAAS